MKKAYLLSLAVAASFFAACGDDSSNSAGTSCTVKDNGDNSYTLSCPDGTSATIRNGVDGKDGADGAGSLAVISFSNKEPQGFVSPLSVEISDFDLITKEDSVQFHASSNSDANGLDLWAKKSGVKYIADLYFSAKKESSKLAVANGDKVTITYKDPNPETEVSGQVVWTNYTASSSGTLTFDKKQYLGDGAAMTIVLTDADLANETTASINLCVGATCSAISLSGAGGVFSAQIKLSTTENIPAANVLNVVNGDALTATYSDKSPAQTIQANSVFFTARQGYVQFGQDIWNIPENIMVYVYDEDNLDSIVEVTLTSDINKTGVKLHLNETNGVYWGMAKISLSKPAVDTVLQVKDGGNIFVTYYDSSTGVSKSDQSILRLSDYTKLDFGDTVYYGYEDKAVVSLTDYHLGMSPAVVHVWSNSDKTGRNIELHYYGGGTIGYMQHGFVEFTNKTPYEGQLKVSNGDMIYVEYVNWRDSTYRDSAVWRQ